MRYFVNDRCIGCGLCQSVCPRVFRLKDGMAVAKDTDVDDPDAAQALRDCPVRAIEEK